MEKMMPMMMNLCMDEMMCKMKSMMMMMEECKSMGCADKAMMSAMTMKLQECDEMTTKMMQLMSEMEQMSL